MSQSHRSTSFSHTRQFLDSLSRQSMRPSVLPPGMLYTSFHDLLRLIHNLLRLIHKAQGVFCHCAQRTMTVFPFVMLHCVVGLAREFSRSGIAADQTIDTCSVRKDICHSRVVIFAAAFKESNSTVQLLFRFLVLTGMKEECTLNPYLPGLPTHISR